MDSKVLKVFKGKQDCKEYREYRDCKVYKEIKGKLVLMDKMVCQLIKLL